MIPPFLQPWAKVTGHYLKHTAPVASQSTVYWDQSGIHHRRALKLKSVPWASMCVCSESVFCVWDWVCECVCWMDLKAKCQRSCVCVCQKPCLAVKVPDSTSLEQAASALAWRCWAWPNHTSRNNAPWWRPAQQASNDTSYIIQHLSLDSALISSLTAHSLPVRWPVHNRRPLI